MPLKREGEPGGELSPDAKRMVDALRYANYQSVGTALGVSRSAVQKWAQGRQVTPWNLSRVEALLGTSKEAPPPQWATGLVNDVPLIRGGVEQVLTDLAILRALLEARQSGLLPPDDDPVDDPPLQPTASRRDQ